MASAAFKAWRDADPSRAEVSRFDLEPPEEQVDVTVDYAARAHELGIHLFPNSNYPFIICLGILFLGARRDSLLEHRPHRARGDRRPDLPVRAS